MAEKFEFVKNFTHCSNIGRLERSKTVYDYSIENSDK